MAGKWQLPMFNLNRVIITILKSGKFRTATYVVKITDGFQILLDIVLFHSIMLFLLIIVHVGLHSLQNPPHDLILTIQFASSSPDTLKSVGKKEVEKDRVGWKALVDQSSCSWYQHWWRIKGMCSSVVKWIVAAFDEAGS
ncbi:hypothetical protein BU17DRAFT_64117 [Hysterangium stoloniferum]|nr:hypothetical protein BU17DRAFT_64117 [Hysterangium stoloniferum]